MRRIPSCHGLQFKSIERRIISIRIEPNTTGGDTTFEISPRLVEKRPFHEDLSNRCNHAQFWRFFRFVKSRAWSYFVLFGPLSARPGRRGRRAAVAGGRLSADAGWLALTGATMADLALSIDTADLPADVREKLAELELELSEGEPQRPNNHSSTPRAAANR